jgi:hypothetical protein
VTGTVALFGFAFWVGEELNRLQERWGFPVPQIDDGSIIPRATDSVTVNSSFDFSDIGTVYVL